MKLVRIILTGTFAVLLIATAASTIPRESPTFAQELSPAQSAAREELNKAAQEFKDGNFAAAQQHTERALSLDPSNRTARLFLARVIHQQYKQGDFSPANLEKARAAIVAYQAIQALDPDNDEAYKAVAVL